MRLWRVRDPPSRCHWLLPWCRAGGRRITARYVFAWNWALVGSFQSFCVIAYILYISHKFDWFFFQVFKAIKRALPVEPRVRFAVADFEKGALLCFLSYTFLIMSALHFVMQIISLIHQLCGAGIWQGLRGVFPDVAIHGCSFHWAQAVYRKVQELGLGPAYSRAGMTQKVVRRLLSLPFLPHEHMKPAFDMLREKVDSPSFESLFACVNATWFESSVWDASNISCFMRSTRTNNDVEGWHRRINSRAGRASLHFYRLIDFLHQEAQLVPIQVSLVSEGKLTRRQRKSTTTTQGKLFKLWEAYNNNELSSSKLLKQCGRLYCPL